MISYLFYHLFYNDSAIGRQGVLAVVVYFANDVNLVVDNGCR